MKNVKWLCVALAGLAACGSESDVGDKGTTPPVTRPSSGPVTVMGQVALDDSTGTPTSLAGVDVSVTGDFNNNGQVEASEVAHATTDADGRYALTVELASAVPLVASFKQEGKLSQHKRVVVSPPTVVEVNASLATGAALTIEGNRATLDDGTLRITGLPEGLSGVARVFNPATEFDAFPGDFEDEDGTRIESAAFCKVELRDSDDKEVHDLGKTAELDFEIPIDTWGRLRDMDKGNDRIDVPQYDFDESKGQWVLVDLGYLIDEAGDTIPEAAYPAIRDKDYDGRVFARFEVTHFSTKNVDMAVTGTPNKARGKAKIEPSLMDAIGNYLACKADLPSCVPPEDPPPVDPRNNKKRKLKDYSGTPPTRSLRPQDTSTSEALVPLAGAFILADFYDVNGDYLGHMLEEVEADGSFDLVLGQSEPDGEDLDDNGIAGEKVFMRAIVNYGGLMFHLVEGEVPTTPGYTIEMGDVDLNESWLTTELCELSGRVIHLDGSTAPDTEVSVYTDFGATTQELSTFCAAQGKECLDLTTTGPDGTFLLAYPYVGQLRVVGTYLRDDAGSYEYYTVSKTFGGGCPAGPIELMLTSGYAYEPVAVEVAGQTISWDPPQPMDSLFVGDPGWQPRWTVEADSQKLVPPLEFGVLPPGALEGFAATGSLIPGDNIQLRGEAKNQKGYRVEFFADYVVP